MEQIVLIIHVFAAISIVALVLLQQGKGSDVGAAFGSGSSNTMFGSQGSLPFFMKLTAVCAAVFFLTSLFLAHLAHNRVQVHQAPSVPVATVPAKVKQAPSLPMTMSGKKTLGSVNNVVPASGVGSSDKTKGIKKNINK